MKFFAKNKKSIIILAILLFNFFAFNAVLAADGDPIVTSKEDVFKIMKNILNFMYTGFFILAIIFILLAAYKYLFAKDDPDAISSATRSIMYAAVAIAIALMSTGANFIIKSLIGAP